VSDVDRASPFYSEDWKKYLTDPVFLIGNGKSRENFDLERLREKGTIIGCNALYRDFTPDILVAIDTKMLNELGRAASTLDPKMSMLAPSGRAVKLPNSKVFKTARFNTSGCFAMRVIGETMRPKKCFMLGMDGYPGNVYDSSPNYAVHTLKNFKGVHNYYMQALGASKETVFYNVNIQDAWPPEAENTGKYKFITYEEFEKEVFN
jgi:hypothetical protein